MVVPLYPLTLYQYLSKRKMSIMTLMILFVGWIFNSKKGELINIKYDIKFVNNDDSFNSPLD